MVELEEAQSERQLQVPTAMAPFYRLASGADWSFIHSVSRRDRISGTNVRVFPAIE